MKEKHAILRNKGKWERANFMGPGTELLPRLRRGDKGKTYMDEVSKLHDIEYTLAAGECRDQACVRKKVRQADERMVASAKKAWQGKKDHWFNVVQGGGLIQAKMLLEDMKILDGSRFAGKHTGKYLKGAATRDLTEAEFLHGARREILREGNLQDFDALSESYGLKFESPLHKRHNKRTAMLVQ